MTIVILTDIVDTEEPPGVDLCSKNSVLSLKISLMRSILREVVHDQICTTRCTEVVLAFLISLSRDMSLV